MTVPIRASARAQASPRNGRRNLCGKCLKARRVGSVEPGRQWAVEVQDADQPSVKENRHHDLRGRCAIAGDMTLERMDVIDSLRKSSRRGSTAHPSANRDADTGRLSLKRAEC